MNHAQRSYAHIKFREKLLDLHTEAFEDFFHDLMCARYADFIDVRTHGNLGDQGADGLSLHSSKLYACYAPRTFDASKVRKKFHDDLDSAMAQRSGQFTTFVFVHNDLRGVQTEVATMLAEARTTYAPIAFEQMGRRHLWGELRQLSREALEDLLGCEIPIEEQTYGIGMETEHLAPLLDRLRERRRSADPLISLDQVSDEKLDFNLITGDEREDLVQGMGHTYLVDEYYALLSDPMEHDEVAAGFTQEYRQARELRRDPHEILLDLQHYIHGNRLQSSTELRAGWVVLAYFFERCHIFENVPDSRASSEFVTETGGH